MDYWQERTSEGRRPEGVLGLAAPPRLCLGKGVGKPAAGKRTNGDKNESLSCLALIGLGLLVARGWLVVFFRISWRPSNTPEGETGRKATQRFKLAIKLIKVQAPPMHDNLL